MSFYRMDESSERHWREIGSALAERQSKMADTILNLLGALRQQVDGFSIDQLRHSLQTATRAERAGAPEELVVAALCHDIGKAVSIENHAAIGAEILRPYVSDGIYQTMRAHQDFQGQHYYGLLGKDPQVRRRYRDEPWFEMAEKFIDEWDQASFDPGYDEQPLAYFEPLLRRFFAKPRPGNGLLAAAATPAKRTSPASAG